MKKHVLMSLKTKFAELIFHRRKKYEFRRANISVERGDIVFIYETAPRSMITGKFSIGSVIRGAPSTILPLEKEAETRKLCADYLAGSKAATAIEIINPVVFKKARPLTSLGCKIRPPQSYSFIKENHHGLFRDIT